MVLHDQSPHKVTDLIILACWGLTRMWSVFHQCVAIFKPIIPCLNLCDAHGFIAKCPLNLPNGFHLGVAKLLQNLMQHRCSSYSVILQQMKIRRTFTTLTRTLAVWLPSTDILCRWEKIHACAWRFPTPFLLEHISCVWLVLPGKKLKSVYFLNRPHIIVGKKHSEYWR